MSFGTILNTLLLKPLQLFFEILYITVNGQIRNPGLSIVVLSLVMNILLLPLYKRADAIQDEERDMEARLHDGVAHIKRTFSGDERMMILQTYYRQNHYKPTYVLRGAVSLLLEIPFFMAAYHFLSRLMLLNGVSFGPIADLGAPDRMLVIAGFSINVLPFVMTAVNLISSSLYTKGSPLKAKLQLYAMALFFLIFLYDSPAGLVFYWTLNNVFSLIKTIFYRLKNPGKLLRGLCSAAGLAIFGYALFCNPYPSLKKTLFFGCFGMLLQLPLVFALLQSRFHFSFRRSAIAPDAKSFFAGGFFLAVLTGVLIPSAVISASPQEFVDINYFYHPLWYIASAFCLALGVFVVWAGVFYWLSKPTGKVLFEKAYWILSGILIVNYMFFGKDLGILNSDLTFEKGLHFSMGAQLANLAVLAAIALLLYFVCKRWKKHTFQVLLVCGLALCCMSVLNMMNIRKSIQSIQLQIAAENAAQDETDAYTGKPRFTLSKSGQNVVVIMLDRAMGAYIPYLFDEKPELEQQFSGFVYYSNVISFGSATNFGTPSIFGGYEYTPLEMNKRGEEPLAAKHNEALKLMPQLFSENGYHVTFADPVYANYQWLPDLSIFDEYPDVDTFITKGRFSGTSNALRMVQNNNRNFFCYSIMKTIPLCFQELLYNKGRYQQGDFIQSDSDSQVYSVQVRTNNQVANGIPLTFMNCYNVLTALPHITDAVDGAPNQLMLMVNETPHNPALLQKPDYTPAQHVDNTGFDDRRELNGQVLKMETDQQIIHYQTNMAVLLQLGQWFDYLRENGVYDNTRIILVADHGRDLEHNKELLMEDGTDVSWFYPLLMVKDFNSQQFTTSDVFMTNADVPTLAMQGIIADPVNPFTGKVINSDEKAAHSQYVFLSDNWDVAVNNGNTFLPGDWYTVHTNMWDMANWQRVAEDAVLTGEK